MPLDPSISLQSKAADPTSTISSFLDLGKKKLDLDRSRATYDADVSQRKAESASANTAADVAARTATPRVDQQIANTSAAQTNAASAQYHLTGEMADKTRQLVGPLLQDKAIQAGDNPKAIIGQLATVEQQAIDSGIPVDMVKANMAPLYTMAHTNPGGIKDQLAKFMLQGQVPGAQMGAVLPNPTMLQNGASTTPVAGGNPALTGVTPMTPQGPSLPNQIAPGQNQQLVQDANGNWVVASRAPNGVFTGTSPVPGASPNPANGGFSNLPPNETTQTRDQFQQKRAEAQQAALNASQAHNLNREIIQLSSDPSLKTGELGKAYRQVMSKLGIQGDDATALDTLGKFLERSALNASQTMGPHTNAGLEAQVRANGSVSYTPDTIKNIAQLNDAITTGQTMYQQGLEKAIASSPNGIFATRQFDKAFGDAVDTDALKFKNAVDNGDQLEAQHIIAKAGGKGSKGAISLFNKLKRIDDLSETGQ